VRVDSTVIEADIKYPTDAGLAAHGVKALAREGRKLAKRIAETRTRVRDRSRAMGRRLREIGRTIRRRSGEAKAQIMTLTEQTGQLLEQSVKEARRLAATARRKASLISLSDPDARPIRKGKLGKPNEFGYVTQIAAAIGEFLQRQQIWTGWAILAYTLNTLTIRTA
jgi:IS5 family transposase